MSRIRIRQADHEDYAAWFEMVQDYDPDIGLSANRTWSRIWGGQKGLTCLVLTKDDEVIGFMHYVFHEFFFHFRPVCYLSDLYIRPEHRNQGWGGCLLELLFEKAKKENWERVYWVTHRENEDAQRLYNRYAGSYEFVRYHVDLPCPSSNAPSPT